MKIPDATPDTPDDAWDDLFRQQLAGYADQPPADALNRILAGANPPHSPHRPWVPMGLVGLLLLGVGGWWGVRQRVPLPKSKARVVFDVKPMVPIRTPTTGLPLTDNLVYKEDTRPLSVGKKSSRTVLPGQPVGLVVAEKQKAGQLNRLPVAPPSIPPGADKQNYVGESPSGRHSPVTDKVIDATRTGHLPSAPSGIALKLTRSRPSLGVGKVIDPWGRTASQNLHETDVNPGRSARLVAMLPPTARKKRWVREQSAGTINTGESPTSELVAYTQTSSAVRSTSPEVRLPSMDGLIGHPFRTFRPTANLPAVVFPESPSAEPQASRLVRRPLWFVSLTPLYTYQQINPVHTDTELVSDIRVAQSLATDRLGGRLQLGMEWTLMNRLSLRTSLVYQQMRQSLRYAVQSTTADSIRVVVIDAQSVQVTPIFSKQNYSQTERWTYVGLSADLVWQLNRNNNARWQHYLLTGASAGRYGSGEKALNGFVQAAYGVERPLSKSLYLRVEPTLQLGWQALTDPVKRLQSRPYSYGLSLGLRFR